MQRREFLGAGLLALANSAGAGTRRAHQTLYLSAAADPDERHWLLGFGLQDQAVQLRYRTALPARGHHVAIEPEQGLFVVIARRPDTWLVLGDLHSGKVLQELRVPADRHLFGHGIFAAGGERFYTTESDLANPEGDNGLVVEWRLDARNGALRLERQREFPTAGVGPHELLLLPDQETLVVANGGLRTHPQSGREVLNANSMLPSLVYLERRSGRILEQQFLPEAMRLASIRHLDVNAHAQVALGMQYQGEPFEQVPLVATHVRGEPLRLLPTPAELLGRMQQYVGSVRYSLDGALLVASCPRGNLLACWSAPDGSFVGSIPARDGCGVCAGEAGFVFSSGVGRVAAWEPRSSHVEELAMPADWQVFWDNHLSTAAIRWPA